MEGLWPKTLLLNPNLGGVKLADMNRRLPLAQVEKQDRTRQIKHVHLPMSLHACHLDLGYRE